MKTNGLNGAKNTMSADNWIECPHCIGSIKDEISKLKEKKDIAYDKLTAREYDQIKAELDKRIKDLEDPGTVSVSVYFDYGFDENKKFYISIKAHCTKCNRNWVIKDETKGDTHE